MILIEQQTQEENKMAKKKIIIEKDLKDCSKCNEVRQINDELHCSLNMQDGKTFSTYSKVTSKECYWYREVKK